MGVPLRKLGVTPSSPETKMNFFKEITRFEQKNDTDSLVHNPKTYLDPVRHRRHKS